MNNQDRTPLYPNEAYKTETEKQEKTENQNPIIPLLLSAISKDENNELLKLLLSSQNANNQASLVSALMSSLNKNTKKAQQNVEPNCEKAFPKNEYI